MDKQRARAHAEQMDRRMECMRPRCHHGAVCPYDTPQFPYRLNKAASVLSGRDALRLYFKRGLELAPHLRFELSDVLMGIDGMTIISRQETGTLVADVVVLDKNYHGVEVGASQTSTSVRGHMWAMTMAPVACQNLLLVQLDPIHQAIKICAKVIGFKPPKR